MAHRHLSHSKMKTFFVLIIFSISNLLTVSLSATATKVYDSFVDCLAENKIPEAEITKIVYEPNNPLFTDILESHIRNRRFNVSTTLKPTFIIAPTAEPQVSAAVVCAKKLAIHLKIRSGGHDYEGISYASITAFALLDMSNFRSININIADETAWVDCGAYLGELYYKIFEKSKVHGFPAGACPTVGAGGHISGAGYGNLMRKYGLTVDNLIDAKIVVADGKILDRKSMGEDLFWAISGGGGGSFGVILSFKIKLVPVPATVTVFRVEKYEEDNRDDVVFQYQQTVDKIDNDLFIRVLLQPVTHNEKQTLRVTFMGEFLGGCDRLLKIVGEQFPKLGLKKSDCQEMSWINSVLYWANFDNKTSPDILLQQRKSEGSNFLKRKSDYVKKPISVADLKLIANKMVQIGKVGLVFNTYGGKMSKIPESATPFPHRAGNLYKIQYSVNWNEEGEDADKTYIEQTRELYNFMTPYVSQNPREAFLNYRDLDIGITDNGKNSYNDGKVYGIKYFLKNFDRLVKVKTAVDPDNFFRHEQSIPVLPFQRGRKMGEW